MDERFYRRDDAEGNASERYSEVLYNDSGATMLIVQFDAPSADARTMNAQKQIKNILNKDCFIGGMSAILEDTKSLVNKEMPLYILCAVGASLLILFLSLKETIVPLIFMLGMLFPIAYNFGNEHLPRQISLYYGSIGNGPAARRYNGLFHLPTAPLRRRKADGGVR